MKQFIRAKSIRFGYKLWAMCGETGTALTFIGIVKNYSDSETIGPLESRVEMKILSTVDNVSFQVVYFDNFFNRHSLLVQLRKKVSEQQQQLSEMRQQQTVL